MLTIEEMMQDRLSNISETYDIAMQLLFARNEAAFCREAARRLIAEAEEIEAATA